MRMKIGGLKFGLQTIAWDDLDVENVLHQVKQAGFSGVEIAQPIPETEFENVGRILDDCNLQLVGLSGGNLTQRLHFASYLRRVAPKSPLPYMYVDDWTEHEDGLFREADIQCPIALHPHMFKPIQTEADAVKVLTAYSYTSLMPDTGHLAVAGEDSVAFIKNNLTRIISVHLKDWSPVFGRSLPFYSKGFCPLGQGEASVASVISFLRKVNFAGWVIVEQDYCSNPGKAAAASLEYLRKQMK